MDETLTFANANPIAEVPFAEIESVQFAHATSRPRLLEWIDESAAALDTTAHGITFKVGKLRLGKNESRRVALWIAAELCSALKRRGAPASMYVETDRIRPVKVWGHQTRTLLPHNDGAHCSYLTPSCQDVPSWDPTLRTFSSTGFSTTGTHKMYQGILVLDPGEAISVTTYYDWIKIIHSAHTRQSSREGDITDLQTWLGDNIRFAIENQEIHRNRYLSIGAALGLRDIASQGVVLHAAEEEMSSEELAMFPQLAQHQSPDSVSDENWLPRVRFLSDILCSTLGLTWTQFRRRYETCVPSERFDFVVANNLNLLHGGLMGGPTRQLEPVCLVVDKPDGIDYERWLGQTWRRAFADNES